MCSDVSGARKGNQKINFVIDHVQSHSDSHVVLDPLKFRI